MAKKEDLSRPSTGTASKPGSSREPFHELAPDKRESLAKGLRSGSTSKAATSAAGRAPAQKASSKKK